MGLPAIQLTATELLNFNVGDDRLPSFRSKIFAVTAMWVKLLARGRAECVVFTVGTVDAVCASQQSGANLHGMSDTAWYFGLTVLAANY